MEKSLRHAEELVKTTNAVLSGMKHSLVLDDWGEGRMMKHKGRLIPSREQELQILEDEFQSEARAMLLKMEKVLHRKVSPHRRNITKAPSLRDKIREINREIEGLNLVERAKDSCKTTESRHKLLNLINEVDLRSSGGSVDKRSSISKRSDILVSKNTTPLVKDDAVKPLVKGETKAELKKNLLETQEIVNKGFETARQLTQKVDSMTKLEKKCEKVSVPSSETIDLKSLDGSYKSEEDKKGRCKHSTHCCAEKKCRKKSEHREKKKKRREEKEEEEREEKRKGRTVREDRGVRNAEDNNMVVVIRNDQRKAPRPRLQCQRLPSLHIKDSLQLQKVHSLEILPEPPESVSLKKKNTCVNILSHEEIEHEKINRMMKKVEGGNCENSIKCFNCGEIIKTQRHLDPREVENILAKCNFNVFDPRIDDFVEKWSRGGDGFLDQWWAEEEARDEEKYSTEKKEESKEAEKEIRSEKPEEVRRKIGEASGRLWKKYKEKTNKLKDDYLQLENVLTGLSDKISESRHLFAENEFFTEKEKFDKFQKLSITEPQIFSFTQVETDKNEEEKQQLSKSRNTINFKGIAGEFGKKKVENNDGRKLSKNVWNEELKPSGSEKKKDGMMSKREKRRRLRKIEEGCVDLPTSFGISKGPIIEKINSRDEVLVEKKLESPVKISRNDEKSEKSSVSGSANNYESDFEKESFISEEKDMSQGKYLGEEKRNKPDIVEKLSNISTPERSIRIIHEDQGKGEGSLGSKESLIVVEENYSVNEFEIPRSKTVIKSINEVVSSAFEKGIEYALEHQRKALDSVAAPEQNVLENGFPVSSDSSKGSQPSKLKGPQSLDKEVNKLSPVPTGREMVQGQSPPEATRCSVNCSNELATSLKDVLLVLKDQFVKTQSLADKLTENVEEAAKTERSFKTGSEEGSGRKQKTINSIFSCEPNLNSLQKTKKDFVGDEPYIPFLSVLEGNSFPGTRRFNSKKKDKPFQEKKPSSSEDSASNHSKSNNILGSSSEEEGTAALSGRKSSGRKLSSILDVGSISDEVGFSEGEILNVESASVAEGHSTISVGEVISERISTSDG